MRITPLPHINDNPLSSQAHELRRHYATEAGRARGRTDLTDWQKATGIIDLWERSCAGMAEMKSKVFAQYREQMEAIESLVPFGPDNSADNPADRTIMQEAFHRRLEVAREAQSQARANSTGGQGPRKKLLADAIAFGDDTLLRAVLTAAAEDRDGTFINSWAAGRPEFEGLIDELFRMREFVYLSGTEGLLLDQIFAPLERPRDELAALPQLEKAKAAADAAAAAYERANPRRSMESSVFTFNPDSLR